MFDATAYSQLSIMLPATIHHAAGACTPTRCCITVPFPFACVLATCSCRMLNDYRCSTAHTFKDHGQPAVTASCTANDALKLCPPMYRLELNRQLSALLATLLCFWV